MRKNSPRKWLHACLDLLPVILIPVFMIYSHRHEINDGSIQVQEQYAVDFNEKWVGNYLDRDNLDGLSLEDKGTYQIINGVYSGSTTDIDLVYGSYYTNNVVQGHKYIIYTPAFDNTKINYTGLFGPTNITGYVQFNGISPVVTALQTGSTYVFGRFSQIRNGTEFHDFNYFINFFDLSEMFGVGNEPTRDEFVSMFPVDNYAGVQKKMLVNKPSLTTYNDTDIMSQFTYQLYNSVDKYFNMGNVFNMNGVYDWFNLNIFNGSAPIYIYVVWQIVLYEFVMDLLFLLYGLFMWFIDIVEHLMEKPFKSIK